MSRQRPQAPASASAHMAATQAFLANRSSQANLSASAAAAALRAMSPTPTPIDQIQTKRMVQRQASFSTSPGSGRGRSRGGLQRQHSASSMTERTFRTPSPSPSRQPSRTELVPAPPLPNIPPEYTTSVAGPSKKKKRASSQGAPPPRIASPPLARSSDRGQSLDRFAPPQSPAASYSSTHLPRVDELERTDSRNSVNFSRPLSPRPLSPAQPPLSPVNGGLSTTNIPARAISPVQAEGIRYGLEHTANQPVKKKKKRLVDRSSEGSHLQSGTMASKPVITPLEPGPAPEIEIPPEEQPSLRRKKKKSALSGQSSLVQSSDTSSRTDSDSDSNVDTTKDRRAQRASGVLTKQPSIVREDWEGEQNEGTSLSQTQPDTDPDLDSFHDATAPFQTKRPVSAANVSRKIGEPTIPTNTANQAVTLDLRTVRTPVEMEEPSAQPNNLEVTAAQPQRETSLSPSRSTRFSDRLASDLAAGRKHDPLPRSVSPAKSALKHHPHARGASVTPSESSDISSPSVDGAVKRKKSARVSFDAQPAATGTATTETEEGANKDKKGWLGLGKNKTTLNTIPSNDDMEELMKPRPQLPSFGSVRGQKFRDPSDPNVVSTARTPPKTHPSAGALENKSASPSVTSSETSSSSYNTDPSTGVSSDHAIGAILARETLKETTQVQSNEPIPPEVTSVQGTLSYSDSESEDSEQEETTNAIAANKEAEAPRTVPPKTEQMPSNYQQVTAVAVTPPRKVEVPVVSISPPTPGLEQSGLDDQWQVEVPGGFPVSSEALALLSNSNKEHAAAVGFSAGNVGSVGGIVPENDSDNDSIYSDAAEDPAELDGTGFGSIDAIVDSPVVAASPSRVPPLPESPLARVALASPLEPDQPVPAGSWEETQARWRDLAEQTRQSPTQPVREVAKPSAVPLGPAGYVQQQQARRALQPPMQPQNAKPRRKKKSPAAIAAAASVPAAILDAQRLPDSPVRKKKQHPAHPTTESGRLEVAAGSSAQFRQSMRAGPVEAEPAFRKSLRNANRNSMPNPAIVHQQQRPPQPVMPPVQPRAALQKKHIPSAAAVRAAAPPPRQQPVQPVTTNDSDSESSFRKSRRSKSTTGGQYTMRRSMRGAPAPSTRDDGRNGVRSVSPVGRRPFSADGPRGIRTSMRGSADGAVPTLRGSVDAKRSSSLFGQRQKSPQPGLSGGRATLSMPKHRSRIVDSDDEDDAPITRRWRSRFADDSDDDEPGATNLAPVRGIPRRGGESDSTDLEDSSDNEKPTSRGQAPLTLQIPQNAMSTSATEPLSPNTEKKRGLFGIFRSKKPKDEPASPVLIAPPVPAKTESGKPSHLGFSSGAERDRIIEQTRARLQAVKDQEDPPAQAHGKLQRRHAPQRVMSDSWPLPPKLPDSMQDRPNTSDGALLRNGTTRLQQGSMRHEEPVEAYGRGGKKKRFPKLRKAFGLKD